MHRDDTEIFARREEATVGDTGVSGDGTGAHPIEENGMIPTMASLDTPVVLEPDVMLPAQWDALRQSAQLSGELRLLCAILSDALHCLKRHTTPSELREWRAAMQWVDAHEVDYPMSFESICLAMHLHADAVRSAIAHNTFRVGSIKMRCVRTSRLREYRRRGFKMREAVIR